MSGIGHIRTATKAMDDACAIIERIHNELLTNTRRHIPPPFIVMSTAETNAIYSALDAARRAMPKNARPVR